MRVKIEFVKVAPPSLLAPFTLLIKAGWDSVSYLGSVQMIPLLYSDLPIRRGSNPHPFTILVVRTYLYSVISLANTLTKLGGDGRTRTDDNLRMKEVH